MVVRSRRREGLSAAPGEAGPAVRQAGQPVTGVARPAVITPPWTS